MGIELETNLNLIHGNFFFVDVVGLSDPAMSTKMKKSRFLTKASQNVKYIGCPKDSLLILPTGDGVRCDHLQKSIRDHDIPSASK